MGKWWLGVVLAGGWLAATAAADAQTPPVSGLPPTPPPAAGPAPAPPGGTMPPQGNFLPPPPPGMLPPPQGVTPPNIQTNLQVTGSASLTTQGGSAFSGAADPGPPNAFSGPPENQDLTLFHFDFAYLGWWTRRQNLPVLVTSGAFSDPIPGALGQPNTRDLIFGQIDESFHSGARLAFRADLDENRTWTADASVFFLGASDATASAASNGGPTTQVIARPFFNVNTNSQDADPVAVPNVMAGEIIVHVKQDVYGADVSLHSNYWSYECMGSSAYFVYGAKFLAMDERLTIDEFLQDIPGLGAPGNGYFLNEHFGAFNRFYGGTLGLEYVWNVGPLSLMARGKLGLGDNVETLGIGGVTRITDSAGNTTTGANRALLVQPSNAGTVHLNKFAVAPEATLNAAWDFNEHIRLAFGYDFVYLTNVLRPANQVDPTVNIQALQPFDQVGAARPGVLLNQSYFWAQGLNATLEFSF